MLDEPYQDLTHLTPNHCSSSTTPLPAEHWLHRPTWHKQKPQLTNTSRSLAQIAYRWSHVGPLQEVCSTLLGGRQPPARSSAASLATTTDLGQLCALVNRLHLPPLNPGGEHHVIVSHSHSSCNKLLLLRPLLGQLVCESLAGGALAGHGRFLGLF